MQTSVATPMSALTTGWRPLNVVAAFATIPTSTSAQSVTRVVDVERFSTGASDPR